MLALMPAFNGSVLLFGPRQQVVHVKEQGKGRREQRKKGGLQPPLFLYTAQTAYHYVNLFPSTDISQSKREINYHFFFQK